jgi:hypothetical protein
LGNILKITKVAHILGLHGQGYALIMTKMVGLHFGRFFQQPHLVTLI